MNTILKEYLNAYQTQLLPTLNLREATKHRIQCYDVYVCKICDKFSNKPFETEAAEIQFYKYDLPKVKAPRIFIQEYYAIMHKRPVGSVTKQRQYLQKHLDRIRGRLIYYQDFKDAYERNDPNFDIQNFTQAHYEPSLETDAYQYLTITGLASNGDTTVAMLMAYEELVTLLQEELAKLDALETDTPQTEPFTKLDAEMSQTELTEFILSLHGEGIVKGTMENTRRVLEKVFGIKIKNFNSSVKDARNRKKDKTPFTNRLEAGYYKDNEAYFARRISK